MIKPASNRSIWKNFLSLPIARGVVLFASISANIACTDDSPAFQPHAFELRFAPVANGKKVGCNDEISGLGPAGAYRLGISDLRFYVSNVKMYDAGGQEVDMTLDDNEFQYHNANGIVSLIDLTSNTEGSCLDSAIASAEGTARTHSALTGITIVQQVASVAFDIGVPQPVMRDVIANNTEEGAPSPLAEMYWNWASGYRHFVLNSAVKDGQGNSGTAFVHVGSRDCGPKDGLALEDRDNCTFINNPAVVLANFALDTNTVAVDIPAVVKGVDFVSPVYDSTTFEVIGQGPGIECHSSPMQPDCPSIFSNFGLDMSSGKANSASDAVFSTTQL